MSGAKVVLVDKTSGQQMPDPVTAITSPEGSLSITLPETFNAGLLSEGVQRAGRVCCAERRVLRQLTQRLSHCLRGFSPQLSIAGLAAGGVKRRIGASRSAVPPEPVA
jgi:hypothetical protein